MRNILVAVQYNLSGEMCTVLLTRMSGYLFTILGAGSMH